MKYIDVPLRIQEDDLKRIKRALVPGQSLSQFMTEAAIRRVEIQAHG